ncbi:MAG: DUF72 domain-containing protein [Novosphingobium sp.]
MPGRIHVGVGGWTYPPWRGNFYPPGLPKARELEYAGQHLTGIEINATFYRRQTPESFARWRDAVPAGFVFALKGSRFCTNRRDLREAGEGIGNYLAQGLVELGDKLGPINWQLAATKRFDPDEIAGFLELLPPVYRGLALRHAIEPRHPSFADPAFFALARAAGVAVVLADAEKYPCFDELTARDFAYVRLQNARAAVKKGYEGPALARWAERARGLSEQGRDTFLFFINGAKERAPAAAEALIARLQT